MNMPKAIPLKEFGFIQQVHDVGFLITDISHRSEPKVFIQIILHPWVSFAQGNMHLDGSLAVADVDEFLFGGVIDILEHCWQVKVSHVLERELPECSILIRVVLYVLAGVFVPSAVAQPDVVACISQHEGRCLILVVDDPGVGGIQEAMLQENGLETFFEL